MLKGWSLENFLRTFQLLRSFFVSNNISLALIDRHPIDLLPSDFALAIQLRKTIRVIVAADTVIPLSAQFDYHNIESVINVFHFSRTPIFQKMFSFNPFF